MKEWKECRTSQKTLLDPRRTPGGPRSPGPCTRAAAAGCAGGGASSWSSRVCGGRRVGVLRVCCPLVRLVRRRRGEGRRRAARRGRPGQGRAAAAGPLLASTVRVRAARGDARAGLWDGKALTGMPTLEPDELSSSESSSAATFAAIAAEPALRPRRCAKARALQQASPPLLDQRPSAADLDLRPASWSPKQFFFRPPAKPITVDELP